MKRHEADGVFGERQETHRVNLRERRGVGIKVLKARQKVLDSMLKA